MTCIKTGARVLIFSHNRIVPADIFEVGDCVVIHYNPNCPHDAFQAKDATHILHAGSANEWRDEKSGTIVVEKDYLRRY